VVIDAVITTLFISHSRYAAIFKMAVS
jgi:hypothetical protein